MNKIDISYERNMTGSYMKIPVKDIRLFDEKILLKRKIPGLLTLEKTFINNEGQYWYGISGKQSLENICSFKAIGLALIEQIILSICSEIEILENNMIDSQCLMLNPELIYITNQNGEIIFTAYPGENRDISVQFQSLMEFLLTKIDHSDPQAVHSAYSIYEKTLDSSYSIMDIRDIITQSREKAAKEQYVREPVVDEVTLIDIEKENSVKDQNIDSDKDKNKFKEEKGLTKSIKNRIKIMFDEIIEDFNLKGILEKIKPKKKEVELEEMIISPEEVIPEPEPVINPTICLTDYNIHPQGKLLYEGGEEFGNISVVNSGIKIGKGEGVDVSINKDTVSHFHARISKECSEFYIEDLNSTNGTFVNDNPLPYRQRQLLKINDTIRFAYVKYRFV